MLEKYRLNAKARLEMWLLISLSELSFNISSRRSQRNAQVSPQRPLQGPDRPSPVPVNPWGGFSWLQPQSAQAQGWAGMNSTLWGVLVQAVLASPNYIVEFSALGRNNTGHAHPCESTWIPAAPSREACLTPY